MSRIALLGSHARRKIGEAAAAGDDGVELAEFLVAPVIAALGHELARRIELHARLLSKPGRRGAVGQSRRRRARLDEAVQRREGFAVRERKSRALERAIAEKEPHRPRLGGLVDLVEIAPGAVPVVDGAVQGGAGEQAAREMVALPGGAQAFDGIIEPSGRGARVIARGLGRRGARQARQRLGEMSAAERQIVERDVKNPILWP